MHTTDDFPQAPEKEFIEDVLAGRYATAAMKEIWSPRGKIIAERRLWIALLRAQKNRGVDVPDGVIEAYEAVIDDVNIERINQREHVLRHDVKARIEEFCELAGHEHIHKGMTSRDLTDNVEQMQIKQAMDLVWARFVAVLSLFGQRAAQHKSLVIAGRSHNQIGQVTTAGKRMANWGEELMYAHEALDDLIERYPLRGIKGAMGTGQDMLDLLDGDTEGYGSLDRELAEELGFEELFSNVGQVYPRSLDFDVVSTLALLAAGPANFAIGMRLMCGAGLASEGFKPGQVGSSAMPHKENTRTSERICGFQDILQGCVDELSRLSGHTWLEGDVSCSVVRRHGLAGAFYAIDGLIESTLTVLVEMGFYEYAIDQELDAYLPFLSTTGFLMAAVKRGVPREAAHEAIKEHSMAVMVLRRQGGDGETDLITRLASDDRLGLSHHDLYSIMLHVRSHAGDADGQVTHFVWRTDQLVGGNTEAATYRAGSIL